VKLVIAICILIMFGFAMLIFLIGLPILNAGVSSANTTDLVDLANYPGWTASINAYPWILLTSLFIAGGAALYFSLKGR